MPTGQRKTGTDIGEMGDSHLVLDRRQLLEAGSTGFFLPFVLSQRVVAQASTNPLNIAQPTYNINLIVISGQSLSVGALGWPPLSTTPRYGNVMLGESTRGISSGAPTGRTPEIWQTYGAAQFNPLIAVCQDVGDTICTQSQMQAFTRYWGAVGESIEIGAINQFRKLWLAAQGVTTDPTHLFTSISCGAGGRTVAQLSKGSQPAYWNRVVTGVTAVKAAADQYGLTFGIIGLIWIQGESDARTPAAQYQAELQSYYDTFCTDIAAGIARQALPPAMFTYQTSGLGASDRAQLGPSMAQLKLAVQNSGGGWSLFGPVYPVTDKTVHQDANGYRWLGNKCGQVMHQVITLGKAWLPVYPIAVTLRGTLITIDYNVPSPPLNFDKPYLVDAAIDFPDKGFTVYDGLNATTRNPRLPINTVSLVGPTTIAIELTRGPTSSNCTVAYGDQTYHGGNGCVRDSDSFVADDLYTYNPAYRQWPEQNITALVGRPYPMHNWSCVWWDNAVTA